MASTLAAAGFNRRPLDDDDEKGERRTSAPSALGSSSFHSGAMLVGGNTGGARSPTAEGTTAPSTPGTAIDFDPYAAYGTVHPPPAAVFPVQNRRDGYMPARTSSPPPAAYNRPHTHSTSTSTSSMGYGHATKASIGSTEPLLTGYYSGVPTEPPTPAMGPTLNLTGGSGGNAERTRDGGAAPERNSTTTTTTTTSSMYSADDESEVLEERPKLIVRAWLVRDDDLLTICSGPVDIGEKYDDRRYLEGELET